jgi:uncharacterized protein with gpF-like domain
VLTRTIVRAIIKSSKRARGGKPGRGRKEMEYKLPEIKGVSDKQTAYAKSLRDRYIASYAKSVEKAAILLSKVNPDALKAGAEQQGVSEKEFMTGAMNANCLSVEYMILTSENAGEVIDTLKKYYI